MSQQKRLRTLTKRRMTAMRCSLLVVTVIAVSMAGFAALAADDEPRQKSEQKNQRDDQQNKQQENQKDKQQAETQSPKGKAGGQMSIAEAARRARAEGNVSPAIKAATKKTGDGETRIVITNEVLERVFGPSNPSPKSPEYDELLKDDRKEGSKGQQRGRRLGKQAPPGTNSAERAEQLESEIDRLKKRLLGLRNPYLPRGKASEKERKREEGKNAAERVRMIEEKIDRLEQELLALRQKNGDR
jgi:hypothetical protein